MNKYLGLVLLITLSSPWALASEIDKNGYPLDSDYYEYHGEYGVKSERQKEQTVGNILSPNGKSTVVEMKNKGGYTAYLRATWSDGKGNSFSKETRWALIGQRVGIEIPVTASDVSVSAYAGTGTGIGPGWDSIRIFEQKLSSSDVKRKDESNIWNDANMMTYHVWGTSVQPKWRLMFQ